MVPVTGMLVALPVPDGRKCSWKLPAALEAGVATHSDPLHDNVARVKTTVTAAPLGTPHDAVVGWCSIESSCGPSWTSPGAVVSGFVGALWPHPAIATRPISNQGRTI